MAQAYDFALEKIGMDLHSFSIWSDYVQFLRGVEAAGSFAENQKITAVRRVYQKAVLTPIIGIEILWKEYIQFEQNINPIISEKMSLERSRDYMNARRVAKELEFVTKGLNRNLPAIPPTLTKEEMKQVELWKKYIAFEKSNPLRSEDTALVTRRVMFATEQCLLVLNHHPAMWHQAAQYLDQSSKLLTEKGVRILMNLCSKQTMHESKLDDKITMPALVRIMTLKFWIVYSVIRIKIINAFAFALLMHQFNEKPIQLCRIIYFIHMK